MEFNWRSEHRWQRVCRLAWLCRFEYPIYALIAAVIVTDLLPSRTRKLGVQRLAATVVGTACGATFRQVFQPSAWAIGFAILVAMLICHILRVPDGAKVSGYICGIVMIAHGTHPWSYAVLRFTETSLGIGVAWLISFVPKLIRFDEADSASRTGTLVVASGRAIRINRELEGGAKTRRFDERFQYDQLETEC